MERIVKLFVTGPEQDQLAEQFSVVESYPGFLLVKIDESALSNIASRYPVEDITGQYQIRAGQRLLNTELPRIDHKGKTRTHPDYKGVRKLLPGKHHYLVQFIGPIKKQWLAAVNKAGGKLQSPYKGFSYVVQADESGLAAIAALPFVRWTGHLSHGDRVAPAVIKFAKRKSSETGAELPRTRVLPGLYEVEFFDKATMKGANKAIKEIGFKILESDQKTRLMIVQMVDSRYASKRIRELSAVHGVRYIREHSLKRTSNDLAPRLMNASQALDPGSLGLDGKGEIVAVCDTGLDSGDPASIHPDFTGRISHIQSYPIKSYFSPYIDNAGGDDGPADYDSGHGTHVAGSVLGDGKSSAGLSGVEGPIRGLAHKARLVFQAVEQEMKWKNNDYYESIGRYLLAGIPNDIQVLFGDAYEQGARIHSNSWGGGDPGAYDSQSEQLDRFVWEHRDFCVLVAAGNDGTDNDGDGKINAMSVTSPSTAKNCLCIGACENERPGFNSQRYGGWWPGDYPVAPYNNAPMADDPSDVVAFSSRGPTEDGRIRPDLVAPGTFVLSTRSTMIASNNNAWAAFPASRKYFHMGGTSMATPLAAGAAALVRQYLRRDAGIATPSAALIKAALIAGATRLPGVSEDNQQVDNEQGFGRINLDAVLAPQDPVSVQFFDISDGLETGESWTQELTVASSELPLRVVMAYSDYPGEALVNNLNLMLTAPDGSHHVGNASSGSLVMDATNNVELIHIEQPAAGTWKLDVIASNVPESAQDFALVVMADIGEPAASNLIRVTSTAELEIPDNDADGISDTLTVEQEGIAAGIALEIDLSHTYIGDLILELVSPEGIGITLHNRQGASANDIRKRFDVYNTPALQLLVGGEISGPWRLEVSDRARVDSGTLHGWTLELVSESDSWLERDSEPALQIPDNNKVGITDVIEIDRQGEVEQLEVWVDITHTWIGDLRVSLVTPAGETLLLHDRSGGQQDNLIKLYDLDSLPEIVSLLHSPATGDWSLTVSDNAGRDTGKLNAWGLKMKLKS